MRAFLMTVVALAATAYAGAQEPSTRDSMEWGKYLQQHPDVLGVHLDGILKKVAALEAKVAEQDAKAAQQEAKIATLERRPPPTIDSVKMPFTIKDKSGKVRFLFDMTDDEGPALLMLADRGEPSFALMGSDDGTSLEMYKGEHRLVSLESDGNGGRLRVIHRDQSRGALVSSGDGVQVFGKDGLARAHLWTDGDVGSMDVYNKGGGSVAQMRGTPGGHGRFTLSNSAGTIMVEAGTTPSGVGLIRMGPDGNGVAATLGNFGKAASSLQGKKSE